jgi:DNA-binding HxlR family transcriptional regulator
LFGTRTDLICKQVGEAALQDAHRSGCPINLTLEVLGDRWSLIVIRDVMFGNRRRYRELLGRSEEGIASNVLADRLKRLVAAGLLSRTDNPRHKQSVIYSLTEPAIQLVPMLAAMGAWGRRHAPGICCKVGGRPRKRRGKAQIRLPSRTGPR